jgi:hypothetical protein
MTRETPRAHFGRKEVMMHASPMTRGRFAQAMRD